MILRLEIDSKTGGNYRFFSALQASAGEAVMGAEKGS
jgi:hypothetical protein